MNYSIGPYVCDKNKVYVLFAMRRCGCGWVGVCDWMVWVWLWVWVSFSENSLKLNTSWSPFLNAKSSAHPNPHPARTPTPTPTPSRLIGGKVSANQRNYKRKYERKYEKYNRKENPYWSITTSQKFRHITWSMFFPSTFFLSTFFSFDPMCFITMKLWRSYAVTAIALWPVIAENCDVVTRNYDEKIAVTRSYGEKITVTHNYVQVFRNYGSQWRRNWYKR